MLDKEFLDKYGHIEISFYYYYKFRFTFQGKKDGVVLTVSIAPETDLIYKMEVDTTLYKLEEHPELEYFDYACVEDENHKTLDEWSAENEN